MEDTQGLSIDLGAIADNYRLLQKTAGAVAGAAVKANGYGLGIAEVAPVLASAGCRDFFVATVDEGVRLRKLTKHNIYVLGGIYAGSLKDIKAHKLIPVLNCLADIKAFEGPCAIHFDTGMNRLGLSAAETEDFINHPAKNVVLALSHFACSDSKNHPMNTDQRDKFNAIRARLSHLMPETKWSLRNSSGVFQVADCKDDIVRPGYALYGGNPMPDAENPMRPVVALNARVLQIRQVRKGETVGYSATHNFSTDSETATVCLGYADGIFRATAGNLYWDGLPCPILGRVSMDLISVGIGHLAGRKPTAGAVFEVIGPNQDIDTLARHAGTIGYEVLTSLGARYKRRYIRAHEQQADSRHSAYRLFGRR
jgi:alanine racemase